MQVKTIYLINNILYVNGFIVIMLIYDSPNPCSLCANCDNFSKFCTYCHGFYYREEKLSISVKRYLCDPCYNKLRLLA